MVDSMAGWTPERRANVLGLNALQWMGKSPEDFWR